MMTHLDLRQRTKDFALRVIKLTGALSGNRESDVIDRQLLKSGTSIGANWREATRASSKRHFVTTTEICIREADETAYWLELLSESEIVRPTRLTAIRDECNQLLAILTATAKRAKQGLEPARRRAPRVQNS